MTVRSLLLFGVLALVATGALGGGSYQHTRDGQTLIWNNYPTQGEEPTWSGGRDSNGFATGYGTVTWYRVLRGIVTGSNIPSATGRAIVINRISGKMIRGRFEGPVVSVDARGKTSHGTFVNGIKVGEWAPGPLPIDQQSTERVSKKTSNPEPPAEGPPPVVAALSTRSLAPETRSPPPVDSGTIEPAIKSRMIADFREQTQSVLSRLGGATENFHEVDRLDAVQTLPGPVSESVGSLVDRARDFRAKLGYETALSECATETQTVDALAAVDQAIRNIAGNDAAEASFGLADFLKNNPEPTVDGQKPLWRYLTSIRLLCSRLEKEADIHLQRAKVLASAGRTGEALREYEEAYRTFPNPATAEKIHHLQSNSLGL